MALKQSTDKDIHNKGLKNADLGGSGIELSQIAGNIYDSLEYKDRDSHTYVTANETAAKASSDTTNLKSKGHSNGTATSVAFSSLKVEIPCWAAIGALLFCTLICTISGGIVYQVINSKITEIERQTSHNKDTTSSANITEALVVAINVFKAEVSQLNDVWEEQFSSLSNNQSASREYQMDMNQRLGTINNLIQAVQEKQNASGRQVAFTVTTPTGTLVDKTPTFRDIVLNVGGAYNTSTGRFTCPIQGVYLFTLTLLSVGSRSTYVDCDVHQHTTRFAQVHSREGKYDSASITAFIHLSVGDVIYLRCDNWNLIYMSVQTLYSGSLIRAD